MDNILSSKILRHLDRPNTNIAAFNIDTPAWSIMSGSGERTISIRPGFVLFTYSADYTFDADSANLAQSLVFSLLGINNIFCPWHPDASYCNYSYINAPAIAYTEEVLDDSTNDTTVLTHIESSFFDSFSIYTNQSICKFEIIANSKNNSRKIYVLDKVNDSSVMSMTLEDFSLDDTIDVYVDSSLKYTIVSLKDILNKTFYGTDLGIFELSTPITPLEITDWHFDSQFFYTLAKKSLAAYLDIDAQKYYTITNFIYNDETESYSVKMKDESGQEYSGELVLTENDEIEAIANIQQIEAGIFWESIDPPASLKLFSTTANTDVSLQINETKSWDGKLYWTDDQYDSESWQEVEPGDILTGQNIYIRGENNTYVCYYDEEQDKVFTLFSFSSEDPDFGVSGLTSSLLGEESTPISNAFNKLFAESNIVDASRLICDAMSVDAANCYDSMFDTCTKLISAPILPSTTLSDGCYASMFCDCESLTSAPMLPATTLTDNCYSSLFEGCASLAIAPELSATTLSEFCYAWMFQNCTSLTVAPVLPATTLANSCYWGMFDGCTSLTTAPVLPATILAKNCYQYMFDGCTALTSMPILSATTLTENCYFSMFAGCTSLATVAELPATTLASQCYMYMFRGCTALVKAPNLPATTIAYCCYASIFKDCTSLNEVHLSYTGEFTSQFQFWLSGAGENGKLYYHGKYSPDTRYHSELPTGWSILVEMQPSEYLTFTGDDLSFTANTTSIPCDNLLYYSYNLSDWHRLAKNETILGNTFYLAGNNTRLNTGDSVTSKPIFSAITGTNCSISGNLRSLLAENATPAATTFMKLFGDNTKTNSTIVDASNLVLDLDVSTLPSQCYAYLFAGCTALTAIPNLPNTELGVSCYQGMFYGCASLTTPPALPKMTLRVSCYENMFINCTSLTTAPSLPATTLAKGCYAGMFTGCTSLTAAPILQATTLADNCYYAMFAGCTSLTTAPALPATTLASFCYTNMFNRCTSITTPPALAATTLENYCYQGMFSGCTSLTTMPDLQATTLTYSCYNGMFSGCTSLVSIKPLPATTVATSAFGCYQNMFSGCTSLVTLPELPILSIPSYCYENMFRNCTGIKLSTTQDTTYTTAYRIPTTGTGSIGTSSLANMFTGTGGTFVGKPTVNITYYTSNTVIPVS